MKYIKWSIGSLVVALIGIQFIPSDLNQSDTVPESDIARVYRLPDGVATSIRNACYDCHSNNTRYPWYSRIQPIGMWMGDHIEEGKDELNFNEFGNYSVKKKKKKLEEIIVELEEEEMPPLSYVWMHGEAHLSESELYLLTEWVNDQLEKP